MDPNPNPRLAAPRDPVGILAICAATTSSSAPAASAAPTTAATAATTRLSSRLCSCRTRTATSPTRSQRGELIQLILTVRNRRDTTETIDFTDSRQSDFVVVRDNSRHRRVAALGGECGARHRRRRRSNSRRARPRRSRRPGTRPIRTAATRCAPAPTRRAAWWSSTASTTSPLRASQLGSPLERFTIN